ncbi:hypothetical protein [Deinococcus arcticus]|uniref:hypothetical protein n=1 Tax=Deinococcus arcticus TaxID=2136176 RepID=UPI0011B1D48A|nr:hypothetical protein [Deinococcus arcticus]
MDATLPAQEPIEETLGTPVTLQEDVKGNSVLVAGPPQPARDAAYVHLHLIKVAGGAGHRSTDR